MTRKCLSLLLTLFIATGFSPGVTVFAVQDPPAAASLTGLVLSGSPEGFAFASGTTTYNGVEVANSVSSITVTPTGAGTTTVNGNTVTSGAVSAAIPLTTDEAETITVIVTDPPKTTTTYTIHVTRSSDLWATEAFSEGDGTSGNPYIIDTAEKLAYLASQVNSGTNYSGKYFEMTADISLNDTTAWQDWDENTAALNEWVPIGDDLDAYTIFRGNFNGNGHVVSGVYINEEGSDHKGLFGLVYDNGIVRNLGVSQSFISGGDNVGGVIARVDNITVTHSVEYCWFSGTVIGKQGVGGIVGNLNGHTQYCFNMGKISGRDFVGGVAGMGGETNVSNCYNAGPVSGGYYVGGIISTTIESIENCYNSGVITGLSIPALDASLPPGTFSPCYIGAIIGQADYPDSITGCLYDKQMSCEAGVGGTAAGGSADIAGTIGKLTTQMCSTTLNTDIADSGDWVFENGLYPRLAGMTGTGMTDAALISAVPVRLSSTSPAVYEQARGVKTDFIVGTPLGVSWTSDNAGTIAVDEGIAALTRQNTDTHVILTATKNNVSKEVPLTVLAAPAVLDPASANYDLNASADITTAITWITAASVAGITCNAAPLTSSTDYNVSGSALTIESVYIAGLSPALHDVIELVITYDTGETTAFTVNVINSAGGGGSGSNHSSSLEKTITVTETSSELFANTRGPIAAKANMDNAFSDSVEVKVTDTAEDVANFKLTAGDEVFPFDISLYIKGTNRKTQPADGYTVTISLPIPENLLEKRTSLAVAHRSESGTITTLPSKLMQKDGAWYLVFEAAEFSPYALVIRSAVNYDASTGVPYYSDAKGKRVFIGFAAKSRYFAPAGVIVLMMQNDKNFTDISGHWAKSSIGFTTERELFFGTDSNHFSPDSSMTRAMFATVMGRLYERSFGEIAASDCHAFNDCNYDAYYGRYVDWAAENEIIAGYGSETFGPENKVTREQMAAILCRFADLLAVVSNETDGTLDYPDAAEISLYAKDAALYCQSTGIIAGRTGGIFAPEETATRAEVSAILQRFIETVMDSAAI